jgi:hypothetical protein
MTKLVDGELTDGVWDLPAEKEMRIHEIYLTNPQFDGEF